MISTKGSPILQTSLSYFKGSKHLWISIIYSVYSAWIFKRLSARSHAKHLEETKQQKRQVLTWVNKWLKDRKEGRNKSLNLTYRKVASGIPQRLVQHTHK